MNRGPHQHGVEEGCGAESVGNGLQNSDISESSLHL